MNVETIERLDQAERAANVDGRPTEADHFYRLKRVAMDAADITAAETRLVKDLRQAKSGGATLRELAEVSGLSVETVRTRIGAKP